MRNPIPIHLAVEDPLSEDILRVLLKRSRTRYAVGFCYRQGGFGYLKKNIAGFNNAAKGTPFLVLTDLDTAECPPTLMEEWFSRPRHPNLLFRVAVREAESWILAHREALAKFLGIKSDKIPMNVDEIKDPKQCLINLARQSSRSDLRRDIVPPPGRKQGPDYNGRLAEFVSTYWRPAVAATRSLSLKRTIVALDRFQPVWSRR